MRGWVLFCGVVVCAIGIGREARGDWDFQLGVGYSQVDLGNGPFDGRGGARIEPRFSYGPEGLPQLRLGIGVGFSGYWRDVGRNGDEIVIHGDTIFLNSDDVESLSLIEPEFQLSWRQPIGMRNGHGFYVEGGAGVGGVIGNYWVGQSWGWDEVENAWDAAFEVRPFVRAAYQWENWQVGVEGSYMFGQELDFSPRVQGDVSEWYVGAFFGIRF
jgi:hypothetical protein